MTATFFSVSLLSALTQRACSNLESPRMLSAAMSFDQLLHHCFKSLDSQISIWRIWINENMNVIDTHFTLFR
jgi:hypothetical protein